ncbi:hypothetical protein GOP47_0016148 [Adiantum capillus-veneris]|uniref:Uncharacterized protein n=1 Tax=Adiantum capillus-veneris TaxID=13818 RepID=A0A9D4ZD98_ADICA|nr:hypothetical protein GOP47_0015833 [Adiantum capillus-veneris]KAI5069847.1 hypothetical protein GOP47_0016148 [Adiantum capillus-veneris]
MSGHHHHHQPEYVEECYGEERMYAAPHHHHHHQPQYVEECYGEERMYAAPPPPCGYERVNSGYYGHRAEGENHGHHGHKDNYHRNERFGELGAAPDGAFAVYEGHKTKSDPNHATKHKHEAEAAALGAFAPSGYAYSQHRKHESCNDPVYY